MGWAGAAVAAGGVDTGATLPAPHIPTPRGLLPEVKLVTLQACSPSKVHSSWSSHCWLSGLKAVPVGQTHLKLPGELRHWPPWHNKLQLGLNILSS